jgi:ribosomal-protein-alanine acetyltransferase
MTLKIESASIQHLDQLYEIEKKCFDKEAFSKQQIALLLTDYDTISLVAKNNDEIVGFIIAVPYLEREAVVGHILTINVAVASRRQNVGTKLLNEMERIFKEKDMKVSQLEVREDNQAALGLYQKLGYKIIGRLRNYYGNADGLYLRKDLTESQQV